MKTTLGILVILIYGLSGLAQEVPPGYGTSVPLDVGIRALGMGGAYVAIAEGPTASYWNPAGLSGLTDFQVEGMYTDWLGLGINYQYVSIAGYPPFGGWRPALGLGGYPLTLGLCWFSVNVTDIPWWEGSESGTFSTWSHVAILSTAVSLSQAPSISVGANVKVYHDRILEGQSLGVGYDLGFLWRAQVGGIPVQLGLSTTDLGGTTVHWSGTTGEPETYVPWLVRVGVASHLWQDTVILTASYEWGVDQPRFERVRVGGEVRLAWLSLRAGWDQPLWLEPTPDGEEWERARGQWTAGAGIAPWEGMAVEYSFLPGALGDTHLFGLRLGF